MTIPPIYTKDYYAGRECLATYCKNYSQQSIANATQCIANLTALYSAKFSPKQLNKSLNVKAFNGNSLRDMRRDLISSIEEFAKDCKLENKSVKVLKAYLQSKLLKQTGCYFVEDYLNNKSPIVNTRHYFSVLKKIKKGNFLSNQAKAEKREDYSKKLTISSCKIFQELPTKEVFEQVVINGQPHAIFCDIFAGHSVHFHLPEHNIIVFGPLTSENQVYLHGKNIILFNRVHAASGSCFLKASKSIVTLNAEDEKSSIIKALFSSHFPKKIFGDSMVRFLMQIITHIKSGNKRKMQKSIERVFAFTLKNTSLHKDPTSLLGKEMEFFDVPKNPYLLKPPISKEMLQELKKPIENIALAQSADLFKFTSEDVERMKQEIQCMLKKAKQNNDYYLND